MLEASKNHHGMKFLTCVKVVLFHIQCPVWTGSYSLIVLLCSLSAGWPLSMWMPQSLSVEQEILVTSIKVVDLLASYVKGGKIG